MSGSSGPRKEYTKEERDECIAILFSEIAKGKSIMRIIQEQKKALVDRGEEAERFPAYATLHSWIKESPEYTEGLANARMDAADFLADEIKDIADEQVKGMDQVSRNKLRVDTRKWIASKLKPKTYGDRVGLDVTVEEKLSDEEIERRLAVLVRRLGIPSVDALGQFIQARSTTPVAIEVIPEEKREEDHANDMGND
jgi:hypothetical protein